MREIIDRHRPLIEFADYFEYYSHCLYFFCSYLRRCFEFLTPPSPDLSFLHLVRRHYSIQVINILVGGPTQLPPNQIDDIFAAPAFCYRGIDLGSQGALTVRSEFATQRLKVIRVFLISSEHGSQFLIHLLWRGVEVTRTHPSRVTT